MSLAPSQHFGIALPITTEFYQVADRFAQQCPFADKSAQIRRNTLAVCAVNAYLELLEIPSAIAQGDSWNPMMQMMTDAADLVLPEIGALSCRAVEPDASTCHVPPEDWHDRMGYVAVVLDEAAHEAKLIGFTTDVDESESVALGRFGPMESLVDEVHRLYAERERVTGQRMASVRSALTQLGQWVEGAIAASWQAADTLINPTEVSFAFRSAAELAAPQVAQDISRAKLVDLGIQLGQSVRVALVVHVMQMESDRRSNIILQVRPLGDSPYLPEGLVLSVLDEQDETFRTATSRAIDNYIQLRISGQVNEVFGVKVAMGDATFKEQFVI
ncbi:MAG: DUF1822 family protein [Phormidesmis sp.]